MNNDHLFYPVIKVPDRIIKAKSSIPKPPPRPSKPDRPDMSLKETFIPLVLLALFFYLFSNKETIGFSFFVFGGVIYYLYKKKKGRENKYSQYEQDLLAYEELEKKYYQNVKNILSENNLLNHRFQEVSSALKYSSDPEIVGRYVLRGNAEVAFARKLAEKFPLKISDEFQLGSFSKPYVPDIVYFDNRYNLYVDIEIDEPYVSVTGEPIHMIGRDDARDNYFLNQGWLVVRFSERQVKKFPNQCIAVIEKLISNILNPNVENPKHGIEVLIEKDRRWSKEEAIHMAHQGYREFY